MFGTSMRAVQNEDPLYFLSLVPTSVFAQELFSRNMIVCCGFTRGASLAAIVLIMAQKMSSVNCFRVPRK